MNNFIFPEKLKPGDEVRIIAPSYSYAIISPQNRAIAEERLRRLGLKVSFGKHIEEIDEFTSSSIQSRVIDLHEAFSDSSVKGILTVIGGYNSNQLLQYIDWKLIKNNPKIFCGFSDITVLSNAILSQTGLITYSGPHFSTFAQEKGFEYTQDYFQKLLMYVDAIDISPAVYWSDDHWWENQEKRNFFENEGFWIINEGVIEGTIIGGNLSSFSLLLGSQYLPDIDNCLLFLEDDEETNAFTFDRLLQALAYSDLGKKIKGLVIGRFQQKSNISKEMIKKIVQSKKPFKEIPILANLDFGHTDPKFTYPIGGWAKLSISHNEVSVIIRDRKI